MKVSRKNKSIKTSSKSLKRSKNVRNNKKTRKHMKKMRGGEPDFKPLINNDNVFNELNSGTMLYRYKRSALKNLVINDSNDSNDINDENLEPFMEIKSNTYGRYKMRLVDNDEIIFYTREGLLALASSYAKANKIAPGTPTIFYK